MAGLAADRRLSYKEVRALERWLEDWSHLRTLWPYDECEALVVGALTNSLPASASDYLNALAAQFPIAGHAQTPTGESVPLIVTGVCAVDPLIEFCGRRFVFTGESQRWTRREMEDRVTTREGIPHPRVTQMTDYLVVCDQGQPLWAFGCYGRKVEQAYNLRREGHPVVIVRENDFWDAVANN